MGDFFYFVFLPDVSKWDMSIQIEDKKNQYVCQSSFRKKNIFFFTFHSIMELFSFFSGGKNVLSQHIFIDISYSKTKFTFFQGMVKDSFLEFFKSESLYLSSFVKNIGNSDRDNIKINFDKPCYMHLMLNKYIKYFKIVFRKFLNVFIYVYN